MPARTPSTLGARARYTLWMLTLTTCTLETPEVLGLIHELTSEMQARYPESDSPTGGVSLGDFLVPECCFVLAHWEGQLAGCAGLRPYPFADHQGRSMGEIKRMFVRPGFRGKGVALQMLLALEDFACQQGFSAIRLETGTRQPEAIALYQKAGYLLIPPYADYSQDPTSVCMEKPLQTSPAS